MNLKKLIIYKHNILFSILSEIKNSFNFDIIEADDNNIDEFKKKINSDSIILTLSKKGIENPLIIDQLPIKIEKLIEKINIKFLKAKFNFQSNIDIGNYKLNINSREISKNKIKLNLTERETNLIIFINQSSNPVKIDKLQKEVWSYGAKLETHTVETHIYRLRKKIKQKFNDSNFIKSSKEGYLIN
jgi:hypothetical protein